MHTGKYLISAFLTFSIFQTSFSQIKDKNTNEEGFQFTNKIEIPTSPVKDQGSSGTCWSFATTSFIETELIRLGKGEYDLSEMFFVRYAYPQKAQKYIRYQGNANFGEGGQAHDVFNIIRNFGMVPEETYTGLKSNPEEHNHQELLKSMTGILNNTLEDKDSYTGKSLEAIDSILVAYLGETPEKFTYKGANYTPKSFAAKIGINPNDYVEFTSFSIYPFYERVELEIPDNWSHDMYLNVPLDDFMEIINHALANGYSVNWDGDVSEGGFSHKKGVAFVPERNLDNMNKEERKTWESLSDDEKQKMLYDFSKPKKEMKITQDIRQKSFDNFKTTDDHLMHLIGTATDQNGELYYITKNSWASNSNDMGGKLYMSETFVRLKTIAILVHKDAIPKSIKAKFNLN